RCQLLRMSSLPVSNAKAGSNGETPRSAKYDPASDGSVKNASGPTITLSEPGMAMREASIQDMLRILGEVDYRKHVWNCPFCHVGTESRRELKKHLRKGICKATSDARAKGHFRAFFKYCICKGELLWPQPKWYKGEKQ